MTGLSGEERPLVDSTPEGRAAMAALVATGRYTETADSFDWLWQEARDVADAVRQHVDEPYAAEARVHFILTDTALYDLTLAMDRDRIGSDVEAIVASVRAAVIARETT